MPSIHIFGGGTITHVRNHLALCAPAYGTLARTLYQLFYEEALRTVQRTVSADTDVATDALAWAMSTGERAEIPENVLVPHLHLTRMADPESSIVTNTDVAAKVDQILADPDTRVIVMSAALCDFEGTVLRQLPDGGPLVPDGTASGSHATRLKTRESGYMAIGLTPAEKVISRIRRGPAGRKDVFLVACKTTTGATEQEQYITALRLLKENSANLVLANDTVTRLNMVVVPEETYYHATTDREDVMLGLAEMIEMRSRLHFTRSTVVGTEADLVPWDDARVPANLRAVVDHCRARGAYKPFLGKTAGHFAVKLGEGDFLTSRRKTNFCEDMRLVRVETVGDDLVRAYGWRPSVGAQSQRNIFREHPEVSGIVHFHSPLKGGAGAGHDGYKAIPHVDQRPRECGSHECGAATAAGLAEVAPGIKAVMLENHGPNIVFGPDVPAERVIRYIDATFDLAQKTGGLVE